MPSDSAPDFAATYRDLGPQTTLAVGGAARWWVDAQSIEEIEETLGFARAGGLDLAVLGGGSNTLVADAGHPGVVLHPNLKGRVLRAADDGEGVWLEVGAGEVWDEIVAYAVAHNLAGVECLSGIPGRCGAAPIQNIGAYGQEVVAAVQVYDRASGEVHWIEGDRCGFAYRHSRFKASPDRYIVLGLRLRLRLGGAATVRYPELRHRLGGLEASLAEVRGAVLALRRGKSMVYDPADANHRSAGSFFMNPVLDAQALAAAEGRVVAAGFDRARMPGYAQRDGTTKLSAAWLVERAGFERGVGAGAVGLSSRHTLALINRGGATAAELVRFARQVQQGVHRAFGIWLSPEPVPLGFAADALGLWGPAPPR
jgi:UDP-N-acetylmuramate dehydrogenase